MSKSSPRQKLSEAGKSSSLLTAAVCLLISALSLLVSASAETFEFYKSADPAFENVFYFSVNIIYNLVSFIPAAALFVFIKESKENFLTSTSFKLLKIGIIASLGCSVPLAAATFILMYKDTSASLETSSFPEYVFVHAAILFVTFVLAVCIVISVIFLKTVKSLRLAAVADMFNKNGLMLAAVLLLITAALLLPKLLTAISSSPFKWSGVASATLCVNNLFISLTGFASALLKAVAYALLAVNIIKYRTSNK